MNGWYRVVDDIKLKDGSTIKKHRLVFETTDKDIGMKIEIFFRSIMDGLEDLRNQRKQKGWFIEPYTPTNKEILEGLKLTERSE